MIDMSNNAEVSYMIHRRLVEILMVNDNELEE